jgi:hypothetical protein
LDDIGMSNIVQSLGRLDENQPLSFQNPWYFLSIASLQALLTLNFSCKESFEVDSSSIELLPNILYSESLKDDMT